MRIAVASCWKYRDAWEPFAQLLEKFWPGHPYTVLLTDHHDPWHFLPGMDSLSLNKANTNGICDESWCGILAYFAGSQLVGQPKNDPILLLQEDFFLNAPVDPDLIEHGLSLLQSRDSIGAVRLYPCPGATDESTDHFFGPVARHSRYRTSCQATIWKPGYLREIASRFKTPAEFEIQGSAWASTHLPAEVWAYKRELLPQVPISYLCSAISRARWNPDALKLCAAHGIGLDLSLREVESSVVHA